MNEYFIRNKYIVLHLMVLILGFTAILGELISISSIDLVFYRMLFSFVSLLIFVYYRKEIFELSITKIFKLSLVGVVVALHWIFFFEAVKISVPIAVISLSTSSLFSSFMEPIMLKKKIDKYEVILGIVIILSFFMMYYNSETAVSEAYIYGIISAFLATLFTILNAKYIGDTKSYQITMYEMLGGTIFISIYFLFTSNTDVFYFNINMSDLIYLLILSVICTSIVFALMTEIMKYITPYTLIMAVNLEPVYAIILSFIFLPNEEEMNLYFYLGSFIIIASIYFEHYFKRNKHNR